MEKTARVSAFFVAIIRCCSGGQTKRVETSKASGMRGREIVEIYRVLMMERGKRPMGRPRITLEDNI